MKKFWMIAVVMCAALMIACGGEKKSNSVEDKAKSNSVEAKSNSVEDKAKSYAEQMNKACADPDHGKYHNICREFIVWADELSDSDVKKAEKVLKDNVDYVDYDIVCYFYSRNRSQRK